RLRAGVSRLAVENGRVSRVELDDGSVVEGKRVLSSAGWLETMKLCEDTSVADPERAGRLSFVESVSVLDCTPKDLGHDRTIVFYNDSEKFHWEVPRELCDVRSGVICSPNNFLYDQPLAEGMLRVTSLANFNQWSALPEDQYRLEKLRW